MEASGERRICDLSLLLILSIRTAGFCSATSLEVPGPRLSAIDVDRRRKNLKLCLSFMGHGCDREGPERPARGRD